MRLTTASVAAIVLIAAGIFTFWPGNNAGPGVAALVAQNPVAVAPATQNETAPTAAQGQRLEDKLNQPIDSEFVDTPLKDAIHFLQDKTGIQFVIQVKKLEEAGVTVDTPVSMNLKNVKLRTLLELVLEPIELTYMTKDDLILVTTPEEAESPDRMIVRVYDCRALLDLPRPPGSIRRQVQAGGGGFFAVQDERAQKTSPGDSDAGGPAPADGGAPAAGAQGFPGAGGFGATGGGGEGQTHLETSDAENLIDVITTIVDAESWVDVGGPGAIAEYKGLLSVAATQAVHEKVERLLNMFHQAAGLKEQRVKVVE